MVMLPNAQAHLLPEAAARHERRLEAVRCSPLIMIEAPPPASPGGLLAVGKPQVPREGGDLLRFYTNQPPLYCGIAFQARSLYVCVVSHEGASLRHRHMKVAPEPFLKASAPYRANL